ncbi:hypothetical protein NSK_002819 [Nannochloropsis salina CCMP1776]|jgi:hypothetical protein|uniref:N-acetyltransferase domain-containing protein n=1 Tax=Nannochloropsis salina CCMP1776 TaxID=1027361 RepID=A0A4D9DBT7_9STRA|nr:hypothetical protein NSK_002819 [Nannochloropsis salina CCMP1776]|eukprot:TFJ85999.1 hypothetical protein NSK_002819 [Nannochloropsis salina CCMP1776]
MSPRPQPLTSVLFLVLVFLTPGVTVGFSPSLRPRIERDLKTSIAALPFPTDSAPLSGKEPLVTQAEIEACAAAFGIQLRLSTLGPFYRIIARLTNDKEGVEPIGYTSGFVAPFFKLVHLDTMQVGCKLTGAYGNARTPMDDMMRRISFRMDNPYVIFCAHLLPHKHKVRRRYWKQLDGSNRFPYGCGLLLGAAAMRYAYDKGCSKAELLAINDDEKSHRLLLGFYRTAGFVSVKEVTNDLRCVPDLLVWGGVGTRMDMSVEEYLRRWRTVIVSRGEEFLNRR